MAFARDERGGIRPAVAEDELFQGAVFAPDDPHLVAGHESEPERRPPLRLHHREQIAVRKARPCEQAGEGIALLDPELGRFRAVRPPGDREPLRIRGMRAPALRPPISRRVAGAPSEIAAFRGELRYRNPRCGRATGALIGRHQAHRSGSTVAL